MSLNYSEKGNAAIITLNRPEYLNTLTFDMVEQIDSILRSVIKNDSIHLKSFPSLPKTWHSDKLFNRYNQLKSIRNVCNAAIEVKRTNKEIGSSLETALEIYLNGNY